MKTGRNRSAAGKAALLEGARSKKPTPQPSPTTPVKPTGPSPTPLAKSANEKGPSPAPPVSPTGPPPIPLRRSGASLVSPNSGRAAGTVEACGIVDWNASGAALRNGAAGISRVTRISDGQIEVVFAIDGYQPLESTVIVSSRHAVPCLISWDTYNADSVRVRSWEADGAPSPNGSFSIMVVQA